jgi:anti-sigma regulatory factor (Ser/Thr protein kinase)
MYALRVPAERQYTRVVSAFVTAIAADAQLTQKKSYRLRLAVEEIVTNTMMHGYGSVQGKGEAEHRVVNIYGEIKARTISITIEDSAPPFDITQEMPVVDVNAPLEEREVGGLGVFLVVRYVDNIRYDYVNGHNVNRLTMRRD